MKTINYTKIYENRKFKGKFVAVEEKKIKLRLLLMEKFQVLFLKWP